MGPVQMEGSGSLSASLKPPPAAVQDLLAHGLKIPRQTGDIRMKQFSALAALETILPKCAHDRLSSLSPWIRPWRCFCVETASSYETLNIDLSLPMFLRRCTRVPLHVPSQ